MTKQRACEMARQSSNPGKIYICELVDHPGDFHPVTSREYLYDDNCGAFWSEAVAVYQNGERID